MYAGVFVYGYMDYFGDISYLIHNMDIFHGLILLMISLLKK